MTAAVVPAGSTPESPGASSLLLGGLLVVATLGAQLISLAFGRMDSELPLSTILLPSLVFLLVLTLPAVTIGLVLGPRVGLGAPDLVDALARRPGSLARLRNDIALAAALAVPLGLALLGLRVLLQPWLPESIPEYGFRGPVGGLAVSIGASVAEEVWFRLGLMTLLVWVGTRFRADRKATPTWVASVLLLVALAFGLAHLPQLAAHGAASSFAVTATVLGNVVVSVLYGWCYWKRGLLAAITAHFVLDLVLHVLPALV
jgi:hypothetical protein